MREEIADDRSVSFLWRNAKREIVATRFLVCHFKTNRLLFLQTIYLGGCIGRKNFPLQRKVYKKLHVQITWPTAYHNNFTHLKDLTSWKKRVKCVWRAAQRGLHGWLLSYADLGDTSTPELFVYHEKIFEPPDIEFFHFLGQGPLPSRIRYVIEGCISKY